MNSQIATEKVSLVLVMGIISKRIKELIIFLFFIGNNCVVFAIGASVFTLPSYSDALSSERQSGFTNWVEIRWLKPLPKYLPTNFESILFDDIKRPDFKKLITKVNLNMTNENDRIPYIIYCWNEDREAGVAIGLNATTPTNDGAALLKHIQFYFNERINGHTVRYIEEAFKDAADPISLLSPFGYVRLLKEQYHFPSNLAEGDPMELDRLDVDLPVQGIGNSSQILLVRDGNLAWIYYVIDRIPFSQRRDGREYDPRYRMQFNNATKDPWQQLKATGETLLDIGLPLDRKVQVILHQRFGIEWSTPNELNTQNY